MNLANPWVLAALLLPAAAVWRMRRAGQATQPAWPALRHVSITPANDMQPAEIRRAGPTYILVTALALGIIALARPQWGEREETASSQSREVLIALDLSRSMWAEDMPGPTSRLGAAKSVVERLLDAFKGENVGLVLFAGTSFVQVPMGPDYQIIREFLPALGPAYMPVGGSDYLRMLDAALEGFGTENDRDRYLIVLSDGESTTEGWEKRIPDLLRRNIHVIGIGLGTEQGSVIADQHGGRLEDPDKAEIISRFTPETLQRLAERTSGLSLAATALPDAAAARRLIKDMVESGQAGTTGHADSSVGMDRFQWFLFPAVLLALWSLALEFRPHPRPRRIRPLVTTAQATVAATVLLTVLLAPSHARAHHNADAGFEVSETFTGDPVKRLRAIATHMGRFGYDPLDLKLMVETALRYGGEERARGRLPMAGVIHDAVDAAHEGKLLDPRLAPWDDYVPQLAALLVPFPVAAREQPPDNPPADDDDDDDDAKINGSPMSEKEKEDERKAREANMKLRRGRTEFALGDLSGGDNFAPQETHNHRLRPPPPEKTLVQPSAADVAKLAEARKNMAIVAQADSPARVHQLLKGDAKPQPVARDW